jgi:hypothetical protein
MRLRLFKDHYGDLMLGVSGVTMGIKEEMEQPAMRSFAIVFAAALTCTASTKADDWIFVDRLRVEKVETLTVSEVWYLAQQKLFCSKGHVRFSYWPYDRENDLHDGEWRSDGILMVGFGAIGDRPAAVRLWVREDWMTLVQAPPSREGSAGLLRS